MTLSKSIFTIFVPVLFLSIFCLGIMDKLKADIPNGQKKTREKPAFVVFEFSEQIKKYKLYYKVKSTNGDTAKYTIEAAKRYDENNFSIFYKTKEGKEVSLSPIIKVDVEAQGSYLITLEKINGLKLIYKVKHFKKINKGSIFTPMDGTKPLLPFALSFFSIGIFILWIFLKKRKTLSLSI
jgi:hypothetical protein